MLMFYLALIVFINLLSKKLGTVILLIIYTKCHSWLDSVILRYFTLPELANNLNLMG